MTEVSISNTPSLLSEDQIREAINATLVTESRELASVSVAFIGEGAIHQLNLRHRGRDAPTDVLSFPFDDSFPNGSGGEIYICPEVCRTNALLNDRDVTEELLHMLIHGTLHLLGYEDTTPKQLEVMEVKTRRILKSNG